MLKFSADIYKIGINPVVDPPQRVLDIIFRQAGRSKGPVPVRGKLNGTEFTQTLVKFRGAWRLYINGPMLRGAGLTVGDNATIEIEFDPQTREVEMPPAFEEALTKHPDAKIEFDKLSPSRRREVLNYLNSLKTDASIERNIERFLRRLLGQETDTRHAVMRRRKD